MAKKVSISNEYLDLEYIANYKDDLEKAIERYFQDINHFPLMTIDEVKNLKKERLKELEVNVIFMILSSIEAWIRVDYEYRVRKRLKDDLTRRLRDIDKQVDKTYKIPIEKLCDEYKLINKNLFSELKSVFKLRHWIAHGRYWNLKIGRKYDFYEVYQLAQMIYGLKKRNN